VYVTHDQLEAMSMGDKIAVMNNGVVEQLGAPQEIYDRPASLFVADFIGSPPMNFIPVRAELHHGDEALSVDGEVIRLPALREDPPEPDLVLGVRPEHVSFSDSAAFRGVVFGAEYLGTMQIVTVTTDRGAVKARLPSTLPVRPGEQVGLVFRPDKLSLFARTSGRAILSTLHEAAAGGRHG
jgi:multiple sugar transport system ATP-binding protein